MKAMKMKGMISILLSLLLLLGLPPISFADDDAPSAQESVNIGSELIDIELTGFKGGRNEYFYVPLEQPIKPGKYDYAINVDMRQLTGYLLVKPVAYDENATFVINGFPHDFNVPYKLYIPNVTAGNPPVEIDCIIKVTSGDGLSTSTYTLTAVAQDLFDKCEVRVIEENLPYSGVYQFISINGFLTSESCSIFITQDRAMLFDALNGGVTGSRRGGELKAEIYKILREKFGIADPDNFPIDVVITHSHGDHYGMATNTNTPPELMLTGRGEGKGVLYWPLNDFTNVNVANTESQAFMDGDIIEGPDFGNGPLKFEVFEINTHSVGCTIFLYDNDADGQLSQNYMVMGDAIGSGSYVFNQTSNTLVPVFNRGVEKFWNRIKGLSGLHGLGGHPWQERITATGEAGKSYVEDMYIASSMVMDNPFLGEYDTTSSTVYVRKFSYGTAGHWYNDAGAYDFRDGVRIKDKITPAHLLYLNLVEENPTRNWIPSFNPLTSGFNCTVPSAAPLYLLPEAFGEDAALNVTLNGTEVSAGNAGPAGDRGYRLDIMASDDDALAASSGFNTVKIEVNDPDSGAFMTYTVNIRTINDNALYPLPPVSTYTTSAKPTISVAGANTLNDIKISSFKGGRLEPYSIALDEPIITRDEPFNITMFQKRDFTATMDWGTRTSDVVYITPVPTNPVSGVFYTINGTEGEFPIPYRAEISRGENVFTIVVGNANPTTYTLTINAEPLWDKYVKEEIEPGVWRIQDADGFVTNEDMYLFVGDDKATLFDTGMGEGDLRAFVEGLTGSKPIEVVVTHAHPDHIGKLSQFADCKVYWPENEVVPASLDASKFVYVQDGGVITGPKFGETPINFEAIEVVGHTNGSMCYLYDNKAQTALENSYLVTGDAVSSGSYVFNFGSGKPPLTAFLRDLKKLEGKIAKFSDDFYDTNQNVSFEDVKGLYFLSGHSWQETANMQPIYGPMWNAPMPLQRLAGIQMVKDMRIAAEKVLKAEWTGKLYTRNVGNTVQDLRQLTYRQAGLWYNTTEPAAGTYLKANPSARVTMKVKASYQLNVSTDTLRYEFVSSNPSIVKVDSNGLLTGLRAGTAAVSVRLTDGSNLTSSIVVNVSY
ncbi:MAG: MBL fold metallo-hydrolase [Clostridiales Family XIII bacterium]|jgi:para-nitrobenzyl esterase|nr:MBL fold metallo-hydrolase [Clostridiales Family XIII bacterium]